DDETNKASRAAMHAAKADITDRMLNSSEIPHNKSTTRVDKHGTPVSVTTGSTNWTPTGLCSQSNNALTIRNQQVAQLYLDYWKRLRADGSAQAEAFRLSNAVVLPEVLMADGKTRVQVFFSPNMKERTKPKTGAPVPPDMAYIFDLMRNTKKMLGFLAFF